jgi:phosphoribosyl-ATP pyrophosphohydrolase
MARREDLLGIAEKLPKSAIKPMEKPAAKMPKSIPGKALPSKARLAKAVTPSAVRRRIVALEGRSSHKRH